LFVVDGGIYGIAFDAGAVIPYFHGDLLNEAGLAVPSPGTGHDLRRLLDARWYTARGEIDRKTNVAAFPQGPVRQVASIAGSGYAIARSTAHPEAAWTYLREYMGKENFLAMWSRGLWQILHGELSPLAGAHRMHEEITAIPGAIFSFTFTPGRLCSSKHVRTASRRDEATWPPLAFWYPRRAPV